MRELIREIAPDKAIIISTHILEEVEAVCSRAIIIASGEMIADATPDALIAEHAPDDAYEITLDGAASDGVVQSLHQMAGVTGPSLEQIFRQITTPKSASN